MHWYRWDVVMVGFKNRYMVLEIFLDPNKDLMADDPVIVTQFNVSKAIKDSILVNFGECGLASSLGSFQGRCIYFLSIVFFIYIQFDTIVVFMSLCFLDSILNICVVKYVNPITKLCIIRASREDYQKVWCAITMVTSIGNCPAILNLLDLSGELHSCYSKLI